MGRWRGEGPAPGEGCGQQPRPWAMLPAAVGRLCPAPLLEARCRQQKPGPDKVEAKKNPLLSAQRGSPGCLRTPCIAVSLSSACTQGVGVPLQSQAVSLLGTFASVATGSVPLGLPLAPPGRTEAEASAAGCRGKRRVNNSPM